MSYPGNKATSTALHRIINLMPRHSEYIEPFLGGGGILRTKLPAITNFGFELDPDVCSTTRASLPGFVSSQALVINGCGLHFLEAYAKHQHQLVYADPPYVLSSRRSAAPIYTHEWSNSVHKRFLYWAARTDARVIISGYDSELYRRALSGANWEFTTFRTRTRRGTATEFLWYNFPKPEELHDSRFLGDNFRERERIGRQQRRWVERLQRMSPAQRQALRLAIAERHASPPLA